MEREGAIHQHVLKDLEPGLPQEGMTEAELICELYMLMVREGHRWISGSVCSSMISSLA
jgi:hypothetical protein